MFSITRQITRVARPVAISSRGYADKTIAEKVGEAVKSTAQAFSAEGSIGSKFKSDGEIGGEVEKEVGGEFSSTGAVGSKFEKDGAIGGTGQKASDKAWDAGKELKGEK